MNSKNLESPKINELKIWNIEKFDELEKFGKSKNRRTENLEHRKINELEKLDSLKKFNFCLTFYFFQIKKNI